MDFYLIIFFLFTGILLGFKLDAKNHFVKFADLITKVGLVILLLAMGANLGSNDQIVLQLGEIGFQAFVFAAVSIIFSLLAVIFFVRIFNLNHLLLSADPETEAELEEESADNTMTILIFASVVIGILSGYFLLNGSQQSWIDSLTNYSLAVLLFGVGIDIGASREVIEDLRIMGWKLIVIPILIALGSLLGSVISGTAFGFAAGESAAVGAGFGWYSLSGVLISKLHSAELGSLAFLTNVLRELLTVMILPLVAKYFGSLAVIAPGGATTMDVTLPLVKESGGEAVVIPAFVSGAVLSTLVPILVPLFLNF
ncbi:MAG: lysine exporter LysO family protein [Halanaerobium sp.]